MSDPNATLEQARARGREMKLSYAGAILPAEASSVWQAKRATLIDIRTQAEWDYVGRLPGAIEIEWNHYPSGRNPKFAEKLLEAVPDKSAPVLFLCRSGGRSNAAAALAASLGYTQAFNVLEGFEGDLDANSKRNTVGGWRKAGLPWSQN